MLFSMVNVGLRSHSILCSPTSSTFPILLIFSIVKNVKQENTVCLIALGYIPHGPDFLLFLWPTMSIQHSNICQVVYFSLKVPSTLTRDSISSHMDEQRPRQGLLSSHRPATLWYSGSSIVTLASLHPSVAACEGLFLLGKCLCDKCAAWNNS